MKKRTQKIFFILCMLIFIFFLKNNVNVNASTLKSQSSSENVLINNTMDTSKFKIDSKSLDPNNSINKKTTKTWGKLKNTEQFSLDSRGLGIVANNFGLSVEDIQSFNGDTSLIKEKILYESGAYAYGLNGGIVTDISKNIIVEDLGDLLAVSSNDLQEHVIKLRVPSEYTGTGYDLLSEVIVYTGKVAKVSTWSELDAAIMSMDTAIVDVQNDMTNTVSTRADRTLNDNRKDYVLLGNGYSLDFIGYSYRWGNNTSIIHKPIVDNVDLYGGHYYGPVTMWDRNGYGSTITYRNVNYTGSQVTASFQAQIIFEGKNNIRSMATSYTSYDGTVRRMADTNQSGLESHNLLFKKNTDTLVETSQGDAVILGSWYSDYDKVSTIQPSLTVEDNANVTLRTLGNAGETNSWQTTGGNIPSVVSIQRNGRIDVGNGSNLTIETAEGTTRVPIRLGYNASTSQWTTSINLGTNSMLDVKVGGPISNSNNRAGIMLQDNSIINVGANSSMNVEGNSMTTGTPLISLGNNSLINVEDKGQLKVKKNGGNGNLLKLAANSNFKVASEGTANFLSESESTSTDAMVQGGANSNFIIGDRGIFEAKINSGSGVRNMLNFESGAQFSFQNALKVDLDANNNLNANLISMAAGNFNASIQEVSAWKKEDSKQEQPTYNWNPMYGMVMPYTGISNTVSSANSLTKAVSNDFKSNFITKNFSRILFNYIPDVNVSLEEISDNKKLESGKQLKGTANNNAHVAFYKVQDELDPSKDSYLTTPSLISPVEGDNMQKFHTTADDTGSFSYTIPESLELKAGEKIRAYAFLNGKDASVTNTVIDKTPPHGEGTDYNAVLGDATPLPESLVTNVSDTNPNNKKFTYSYHKDTPKSLVDQYMGELGSHVVKIDITDEANNTTTVTSNLLIHQSKIDISSEDVSIPYKDLIKLSEEELSKYILEKGKVGAYKIENGKKVDLTSFVLVSDFDGLNDFSKVKGTPYMVNLVVSSKDSGFSEDTSAKIKVTVTDIDSIITVNFVNEANQIVDKYTTKIQSTIGQKIDLSKETSILDKIKLLESEGFLLDKRPEEEEQFLVNDTEMTVNYGIKGTVSFKTFPTILDFGNVKYTSSIDRVERPDFDTSLVVNDTRAVSEKGWTVSVSLLTPLQSSSGRKLPNALRYVSNGNEVIINDENQAIYKNHEGGEVNITDSWGALKGSDGIKLQLESGDNISDVEYSAVLNWEILIGP